MAAISSIVWPSMAASKRTRRNFSGNSASAVSRCAWNSFETARSSAVAARGWCSGCDQSVSRCSRRFPERKRSSARRNAIRTSQAGSGCGHEGDRTGDRPAAKLPGLHLQRQPYCAGRREPRGKRAGRTRRGAPRTRAWCQPGLFAHQLILDRATWLDQNQLLHLLSRASSKARPPCTPNQTPPLEDWFKAERPFRMIEIFRLDPSCPSKSSRLDSSTSTSRLAGRPAGPGRNLHRKPERGASWQRHIPRCS